jgi:hypothetical protein
MGDLYERDHAFKCRPDKVLPMTVAQPMTASDGVRRYDIYMYSDDIQFLRECRDGDYVKATDYDSLRARLDAAERERDSLRRRVERIDTWLADEAWSLMRRVLEQGMAIERDDRGGKYETYEHLSARLDEAARERALLIDAALKET